MGVHKLQSVRLSQLGNMLLQLQLQVPLVHLAARHIQLPLPFFTEDVSKVILVEPSYLPNGSDARYSTGCKYPDEKDDNPGHVMSSRMM
jgi:hypothetical protein